MERYDRFLHETLNFTQGSLHIEKSTIQSLRHFWEQGVFLPFILILLFSVIFPVYKLFLICAILNAKNRQSLHKAIEWSAHLRQTAKFQFLDIFVAIFMRAYLNQDVLHTDLKEGFFVYLVFCVLSLITAEVLTLLVDPTHLYDDTVPAETNNFDRIMIFLSAGGLVTGLVLAMFRSVLVVKVALRGSLTVSQSSLSVLDILFELLFQSADKDPVTGVENLVAFDAITGAVVVLVLGIAVPLLFVAIKVFNVHLSSRKVFGMILHDWSLGDVMALGLFTTLISLNSFDNLSAEAPEGLLSGFYFLLMYGLSCFDLSASLNQKGNAPATAVSYAPVPEAPAEERPNEPLLLRRKIFSKLSGSFLLMKSIGWGVFFLVWFMQAKVNPVDIDKINTALRANLEIINSALQGSLPRTVGDCTDPGALNLQPCVGGAPLYYNKERYEIKARWVTGVNTAHLDAIVLSAPVKQKLALSIAGQIDSIPMSLGIGECFTPDVYVTGQCDKIWDNTDACCGTNKRFSITVIADCFEDFPFVRNISINKVGLDPIVISVSVIGFKINLEDVTDKVKNAITDVLEPYVSEKAFISWGDQDPPLTLADLVNRIIKLNAGGMSAQGKFTCPDPIVEIPWV